MLIFILFLFLLITSIFLIRSSYIKKQIQNSYCDPCICNCEEAECICPEFTDPEVNKVEENFTANEKSVMYVYDNKPTMLEALQKAKDNIESLSPISFLYFENVNLEGDLEYFGVSIGEDDLEENEKTYRTVKGSVIIDGVKIGFLQGVSLGIGGTCEIDQYSVETAVGKFHVCVNILGGTEKYYTYITYSTPMDLIDEEDSKSYGLYLFDINGKYEREKIESILQKIKRLD